MYLEPLPGQERRPCARAPGRGRIPGGAGIGLQQQNDTRAFPQSEQKCLALIECALKPATPASRQRSVYVHVDQSIGVCASCRRFGKRRFQNEIICEQGGRPLVFVCPPARCHPGVQSQRAAVFARTGGAKRGEGKQSPAAQCGRARQRVLFPAHGRARVPLRGRFAGVFERRGRISHAATADPERTGIQAKPQACSRAS